MQTAVRPLYHFRLYVVGQTLNSLAGQYAIEVFDLTHTPQLAAGDQILIDTRARGG